MSIKQDPRKSQTYITNMSRVHRVPTIVVQRVKYTQRSIIVKMSMKLKMDKVEISAIKQIIKLLSKGNIFPKGAFEAKASSPLMAMKMYLNIGNSFEYELKFNLESEVAVDFLNSMVLIAPAAAQVIMGMEKMNSIIENASKGMVKEVIKDDFKAARDKAIKEAKEACAS